MSKVGIGLGEIADLSSLLGQPAPAAPTTGKPHLISVTLIDEDPEQPRSEFNAESLAELAADVRERGVKSPISLRPHPERPGRFIINHGARRYRAALSAGLREVPYVLDEDYDRFDQVKENILRDALSPWEIAVFIQQWLGQGLTQAEIAKRLAKSKTFVSHHAALLKLPPPIHAVFRSGQCSDVTAIAELSTAFKEDAAAVTSWIEAASEISRESIKGLRERLRVQAKQQQVSRAAEAEPSKLAEVVAEPVREAPALAPSTPSTEAVVKEAAADKPKSSSPAKRPLLVIQWKRRQAMVLMHKRAKAPGHVVVRFDDGTETEVAPPFKVLAVVDDA